MPTFTAEDGYARDYYMDCTPNANDTGGGGVLLSVPAGHSILDADGANPMQNGGGDLRVTTTGGTQLALDVITAVTDNDPNNGSLIISVPDGQSVYRLWWKASTTRSQPAAASTYGQYNVYSSDVKAYWPCAESPTGTVYDRTTNQLNATSGGSMTSGDLVTGRIGKGIDFDSIDDYLSPGNTPTPLQQMQSGDFTILWSMNPRTDGEANLGVIYSNYNSAGVYLALRTAGGNTDSLQFTAQFTTAVTLTITNNSVVSYNTWQTCACVFDSATKKASFYKDGSAVGLATDNAGSGSIPSDSAISARIGNYYNGSRTFDGVLDEIKIIRAKLTSTQISNYSSMLQDNASFWTLGSVQSAGDAKKRRYKYSGGMQRLTGVQ